MKINIPLDKKTALIIVAASAAIILFPIGYSVVSVAFPGPDPFLERPDEKYEKCVEDTVYMRYRHMDLLKEIRDNVVREGGKGEILREGKRLEIRLDSCWDCHTSREAFCNRCHNAVNLQLGCFRCHYDPESAPTARGELSEG